MSRRAQDVGDTPVGANTSRRMEDTEGGEHTAEADGLAEDVRETEATQRRSDTPGCGLMVYWRKHLPERISPSTGD